MGIRNWETPVDNVTPGSVWQHTNGNEYMVLMMTNVDSTNDRYPETIIYAGKNEKIWSRPLSDWHRSMTRVCMSNGSDFYGNS